MVRTLHRAATPDDRPSRLNDLYEGKVAKLMDFGAFVTIAPGKDGLVHVSQISNELLRRRGPATSVC